MAGPAGGNDGCPFRAQVVSAALGLTALVIAVVTLGLETQRTLNDPVPVFATFALLIAVVSIVWALQAAELHQRDEATIDPLTGLANRRQLSEDLADVLAVATRDRPARLLTFDLDGFKAYNDTFGHPGGDLLLKRISHAFKDAVGDSGRAYRLGGDEFCALIWDGRGDGMIDICLAALSEIGEGFSITSSYGSVLMPNETSDPELALQLSDQRLYAHKDSSRPSAAKQTRDLALQLLALHEPELHVHSAKVAALTEGVGRRLRLGAQEIAETIRAAELHDIGKVAIPEDVLPQSRPARRVRMGNHAPPSGDRGARAERRAGAVESCGDRPREPRALRRRRLPAGPRGRADPARGEDRVRLRFV